MKKEHYSIPEAAKRCAVGRTTMWRWVKSGKVKAVATPGGQHRIWKSDLQFLLSQLGSPVTSDPKKVAHEKPSQTSPVRVLVVDDDASVRKMLLRTLQKHGFQTDAAEDGFEAGVKVMDFNPHAIVLDLVCREWTDLRCANGLRETPARPISKSWRYQDTTRKRTGKRYLRPVRTAFCPSPSIWRSF